MKRKEKDWPSIVGLFVDKINDWEKKACILHFWLYSPPSRVPSLYTLTRISLMPQVSMLAPGAAPASDLLMVGTHVEAR